MSDSVVGRRIREERLKNGMNQTQLAEKAGIALDTVSTLERGEHSPRPSTMRKLARALGTSIRDLYEDPAVLAGKAEAPRRAGRQQKQPEVESALTGLFENLAKRARRIRQRYGQESYDEVLEELAMLNADHANFERIRRARKAKGSRAHFMEPDALADAIDDFLVAQKVISDMIEQDFYAPEEVKREARRFLKRAS